MNHLLLAAEGGYQEFELGGTEMVEPIALSDFSPSAPSTSVVTLVSASGEIAPAPVS